MKKLLIAAILLFGIHAEVHALEVADIETATGWSEAELVQGLNRLDRLYKSDMKTAEGRRRWHGNVSRQIVLTNGQEMVKLDIYESGHVHTNKTTRILSPEAIAARNARIMANTNGVPAKLAAARARRNATPAVTNVTVTLTAGKEAK